MRRSPFVDALFFGFEFSYESGDLEQRVLYELEGSPNVSPIAHGPLKSPQAILYPVLLRSFKSEARLRSRRAAI